MLEEAQIQICIIEGDGKGVVKAVSLFNELHHFIIDEGIYTKKYVEHPFLLENFILKTILCSLYNFTLNTISIINNVNII